MKFFDLINSPALWNDLTTFTSLLKEKEYKTVCKLSCESDVVQMLTDLFHADPKQTLPTALAKATRQEIDEAITEASRDFPDVHPTLYFFKMDHSNTHAIQETYGIQGVASTEVILISAHESYSNFGKLKKCVLHEFNHSARLQHFSFFTEGTFLDWMVMEGLAETYNLERFPDDPPPPWTHSLDAETKAKYLPQVQEFWLNQRDGIKDGEEWFFGYPRMKPAGKMGIPKWLGYRLGFELVQAFRQKNQNLSWNDLIRIPSTEFIAHLV